MQDTRIVFSKDALHDSCNVYDRSMYTGNWKVGRLCVFLKSQNRNCVPFEAKWKEWIMKTKQITK